MMNEEQHQHNDGERFLPEQPEGTTDGFRGVLPSSPHAVPTITKAEPLRLLTPEAVEALRRASIDNYQKKITEINENYERNRATEQSNVIVSPPTPTVMEFFQNILDRFQLNLKTTTLGAFGGLAPLIVPMLGLPAPIVPVIYGAFALLNAFVAKNDGVSMAGMGGTVLAQALYAFGVPMADWLVSGSLAFFGFFSKDQKKAQSAPLVEPAPVQ